MTPPPRAGWVRGIAVVARREFGATLASPIATMIIVMFLVLQGALTFDLAGFFIRDQADLVPFFSVLPWVLLLLVPALTMRLWAEERASGTLELLLTLPLTPVQAVLGKFAAAVGLCALALLGTLPMVATVNLLGRPDNGVIAAGYLGALLLAAALCAIGGAASACTRGQVVAFVLAAAISLLFVVSADPAVAGFLVGPAPALAAAGRAISLTSRFQTLTRGLLRATDLLFFASFILWWLVATVLLVARRGR